MAHRIPEVSAGNPEALPRHAATSRELLLVGLFSLLAAVRVFVFTAAFPFFSHVDEHHHFDLACRYSHGDVPRGLETFSAEASALAVFCASPEYLQPLGDLPTELTAPPPWATPADKLNGLEQLIFAERDCKLEEARQRRQQARRAIPEVAR